MGTERYSVRVGRDHLVFCSGHFISFDGHQCERLHGHNYRAAVEVEGPLTADWYVVDFLALRARGQVELGHSTLGEGQATAALWIARIGVVAGIAAGLVLIALLAAGFDFDRFRDDLQRELEQRRERRTNGVRSAVEGLRAVIGR